MSETLDEMKAQSRQPSLAAKQAYINALEHAIAAYQQAEMPEEPDCFIQLGQEMSPSDGDNDPPQWQRWVAREDYAILRAHAARVTVERNEAKENARTLNTTLSANIREFERIEDALAAAKEAQARAEAALEIAHNGERMVAGALMPSAEKQDAEHGDHNTGEVLALLRFWKQHSFGNKAPIWMDEMKQRAEAAERRLAECEKDESRCVVPEKDMDLKLRIPMHDTLHNAVHRVYFRAGLLACREYMARFVEPQDANIAASIRANWWPSIGDDPGPLRLLNYDEVADESGEEIKPKNIDPSVEALPFAFQFLAAISKESGNG